MGRTCDRCNPQSPNAMPSRFHKLSLKCHPSQHLIRTITSRPHNCINHPPQPQPPSTPTLTHPPQPPLTSTWCARYVAAVQTAASAADGVSLRAWPLPSWSPELPAAADVAACQDAPPALQHVKQPRGATRPTRNAAAILDLYASHVFPLQFPNFRIIGLS